MVVREDGEMRANRRLSTRSPRSHCTRFVGWISETHPPTSAGFRWMRCRLSTLQIVQKPGIIFPNHHTFSTAWMRKTHKPAFMKRLNPVLNTQARHPLKFTGVIGHQRRSTCNHSSKSLSCGGGSSRPSCIKSSGNDSNISRTSDKSSSIFSVVLIGNLFNA